MTTFKDLILESSDLYLVIKQKGSGQHSKMTSVTLKANSEDDAIKQAKEINKGADGNYDANKLSAAGAKRVKNIGKLIIDDD